MWRSFTEILSLIQNWQSMRKQLKIMSPVGEADQARLLVNRFQLPILLRRRHHQWTPLIISLLTLLRQLNDEGNLTEKKFINFVATHLCHDFPSKQNRCLYERWSWKYFMALAMTLARKSSQLLFACNRRSLRLLWTHKIHIAMTQHNKFSLVFGNK